MELFYVFNNPRKGGTYEEQKGNLRPRLAEGLLKVGYGFWKSDIRRTVFEQKQEPGLAGPEEAVAQVAGKGDNTSAMLVTLAVKTVGAVAREWLGELPKYSVASGAASYLGSTLAIMGLLLS